MPDTPSDTDFAARVIETPVADEMRESFLAYSLSVITSRAIPDVRDGLKPVQRRILYSMLDMGLRPGTQHKKCGRIVGDVMGKYHPHGDAAIYDALVRMGQDFTVRLPFVDPKGNFGTPDDPPAAYRYTEARLADAAMEMVAEIDEDTVDFVPNFDGELTQPEVLPARIPNVLVNGTAGIAVGMATSLAPHNVNEVCAALQLVLAEPDVTLGRVRRKLKGPDLPTGGILVDDGSLTDAYRSGRGSFRVRANAELVDVTARRRGIVVTELPWNVGIERVIGRIKELLGQQKLQGITDVKNLSDRHHGTRLQIECRTGVDPSAVLSELYRLTPLEESYAINNVVLVDGRPTTLGLLDLMRHYLDHRLEVVVRRSEYRKRKAEDEAHIAEGLLIALDAIDEVVRIIRSSADTPEARERLIEAFELSDVQAQHILDMPLRRLTTLEVQKLRDRLEELRAIIADLTEILADEARRRQIVGDELGEVADEHGTPRRTRLVAADDAVMERPESLEVADDPCTITLSTTFVVGRHGEDEHQAKAGRHDVLLALAPATVRGHVWAVSTGGRLLGIEAVEVPEVAGRSRGAAATELFDLSRGERLVGLFGAADVTAQHLLVVVTAQGVIKRLTAEEVADTRSGSEVISLKDGDRVVAAFASGEGHEVAIVSDDGQLLRTGLDQVRPQGRGAGGMAGMKVKADAAVVAAAPIIDGDVVVTWTDQGAISATAAEEFPAKGRATGGVRAMKLRRGETKVLGAWVGRPEEAAVVVGEGEGLFAKAATAPIGLPVVASRRDGTGEPQSAPVLAVGRAR
ncbi:MAG: DNA topoisomerase IV subunit A [Actinomycetota bacterium]